MTYKKDNSEAILISLSIIMVIFLLVYSSGKRYETEHALLDLDTKLTLLFTSGNVEKLVPFDDVFLVNLTTTNIGLNNSPKFLITLYFCKPSNCNIEKTRDVNDANLTEGERLPLHKLKSGESEMITFGGFRTDKIGYWKIIYEFEPLDTEYGWELPSHERTFLFQVVPLDVFSQDQLNNKIYSLTNITTILTVIMALLSIVTAIDIITKWLYRKK